MEADNLLFPVNDGQPSRERSIPSTGAPIPSSALKPGLTSDPYRGLEYSILKKQKLQAVHQRQ